MSKLIIINGPNLNLLGEREQTQYGSKDYKYLEEICQKRAKYLKIDIEIKQSNIEGDIVNIIQDARKTHDGIIINAAGYSHTSVAIRDALSIFKKPIIEVHISVSYTHLTLPTKRIV